VSALGHYLEDAGVATTVISLIRLHTETVQSPRALWTPFELGRPLGPPNNPALQTSVLKAALGLLDSTDGPVVLEDFDHPTAETDPMAGWRCPVKTARADIDAADAAAFKAALDVEIARVTPWYDGAAASSGRTTFGAAKMTVEQISQHLTSYLTDAPDPSPVEDISSLVALRFAVDDLKVFYLEAAMAELESPSSAQLVGWFWRETVAGELIIALRERLMKSDVDKFKLVGGGFLVPGVKVAELDLYRP
jgi:hypothetical protein